MVDQLRKIRVARLVYLAVLEVTREDIVEIITTPMAELFLEGVVIE